jgi:cysteine desulfurase / selenocysteine lyase
MEAAITKQVFDVETLRKEFPILQRIVNGRPLVYLDNAATSQKPLSVINAISDYYREYNSNVHRGVYAISIEASDAYDSTRDKIREFINAGSAAEIIFTRGTTDAINLVSYSYGLENISEGDEIIVSEMEHHANIVPWQVLCKKKNAVLKVIPVNDNGELIINEYKKLLGSRTKIVAVGHISNALGTVNPVKEITDLAHEYGAKVLIDGAQAVHHMKVDVQELGADFYTFSGHKMYGPMGIGVLYGKLDLLEAMPPYQTGGDMIISVSFKGTTYNEVPVKFEAGTPNVEGVIGLDKAIDFITSVGFEAINAQEQELLEYATEKVSVIEDVKIIGTAKNKASVLSFVVNGLHPMDVGIMLDTYGVAMRTGRHCTEPLMERFGIPGTVRASFAVYNTKQEIDVFVEALKRSIKALK